MTSGNDGQTGPTGETGNGIASITKTGTSGLVDTYTITYTNGNTTTFTVTNGEDGEVTETELNVLRQKVANQQKVIDQLPQVPGQGTSITLENTIEAQFTKFEIEGNSTQDGTPSPDNEVPILSAGDNGSINEKVQNKNFLDLTKKPYSESDSTLNGATVVIENGIMTVSASSTGAAVVRSKWEDYRSSNSIYLPAGSYYTELKLNISGVGQFSGAFTLNEPGYITQWFVSVSQNTTMRYKLQIEPGTTTTPYVPHEEQDYSIFVQQPMRSIGDVRDCFVKKSDGKLYERHYIRYLELLISAMNNSEAYPGWTNVQQIKNDFPNVNSRLITKTSFLCNIFEKSSSNIVTNTLENNSILYLDKSLLNLTQTQWKENYPNLVLKLGYISPEPLDLPCTETQIQQLENKPSTYKDFTIIQSQDETPAYLEVSGIYDLNNLINN